MLGNFIIPSAKRKTETQREKVAGLWFVRSAARGGGFGISVQNHMGVALEEKLLPLLVSGTGV